MKMKYSEVFKEYLKWFIPMVVFGIVVWFIFKPIAAIALFLAGLIPLDRSRVAMIKKGYPLPSAGLAWKVICTICLYPLLLAVLVGVSSDTSGGGDIAKNIVNSIFVFVLPVFIASCICYLNSKTWARAQAKYGVA